MQLLKILADISFYPSNIIGKDRTYINGYRPAFKIREDMFNSGQIEFVNQDKAFSGDKNLKAYIVFSHGDLLLDFIKEGQNFTFGEGSKMLGEGVILSVLKE
jgi:translation elongation factor EF-Tu-like GTPase